MAQASHIDQGEESWPSLAIAWAWVGVCVLAYICSYLDRQILSLMVDKIKADLQISDSQFGLLHGLSFALLYCTAGLPLGSLVDRYPRRTIIIGGILTWSLMTATCGLSRQYWHLFLSRVGVGIGEATLSPSAYSLLADCFDRKGLGRAISVYFAGGGIGAGLAFMVGGALISWIDGLAPLSLPLLGAMQSWQVVFLLVALPGFPVAFLIFLLREPARQGKVTEVPPGWVEVLHYLGARWRFMLPFFLGMACVAGVSLGTLSWAPAMLMRGYHISAADAGYQLGIVMIVGIPVGLLLGAWLAERLDRRSIRQPALLICFAATILLIGMTAWMALAGSRLSLIAAIFATMSMANVPFGIAAASLQMMVPNAMRGRTSALFLLCQNGLGMVLGPLLPGVINDRLFNGDGPSIGLSLSATMVSFSLIGTVLLLFAYRRSLSSTTD